MAKKKQSKFGNKVRKDSERQQNQSSSYGYLNLPRGVQIFKNKTSRTDKIDIIPYIISDPKHIDRDDALEIMPGEPWYKKPYKVHRGIGVNNESVVCPTTVGKKCPICEYRAKLIKQGAPKEDTDALRPSLRNLYVVIPIGNKDHKEEMHIWDISQFLFQNKLNDEIDDGNVDPEFPSPSDGQTLKIRWTEKTFGSNKFAEAGAIDGDSGRDPYEDGIIEDAPDLDKCLKIMSYEDLKNFFEEMEVLDEEAEEIKEIEEIEKEEEKEEVLVKKQKRSTKKDKCPYGHRFGVDTDDFDDCEVCELWDECSEAKDENE